MLSNAQGRKNLDLTMIATLQALFDSGTVSRAAESLGVTQPSVSQVLKRLRTHFEDELFVRSGNSMRPTPRALELVPLVGRVMRDVSLISQSGAAFCPTTAKREFFVCMADISEYMAAADLSAILASSAPDCSIHTVRIPQGRLRKALEDGEIDLAVGTLAGADRSLRQQRIGDYNAACMVSANGRWRDSTLTLEDYIDAHHVLVQRVSDSVDPITERLNARGVHRNISMSVGNHFSAAHVVAKSDLICTVPNSVMVENLALMFPVKLQALPFPFGRLVSRLLWHTRYQNDPAHIWLRSTVEKSVRETSHRLC